MAIMSLIQSARMNGHNPYVKLIDVLTRHVGDVYRTGVVHRSSGKYPSEHAYTDFSVGNTISFERHEQGGKCSGPCPGKKLPMTTEVLSAGCAHLPVT